MTWTLIFLLPWIAVGLWAAALLRFPAPLASSGSRGTRAAAASPPLVSVVIPARNEGANIRACLESVTASGYPRFEVVVVDDRSEDRTAEIAAAVPPGNAEGVRVVEGGELPQDWFGKPWACWQGAAQARGEILLFTDADTRHDPELLGSAVSALVADGADALTLLGRQIMATFWEKVILPPVFVTLAFRFPDLRRQVTRCQDAIANGQFIMFTREAYDAVGGHEAVRGEVVEDLMMARVLCRSGKRLAVRMAEDLFATRMYRSLPGIVEGWSKNLAAGAAVAPGPLGPTVALPALVVLLLVLWVAPPVALAAVAALGIGGPLLTWAWITTGFGVLFWCLTAVRFRLSPIWGLTYPLGALMEAFLFMRSWSRRKRVLWRGREYATFTAMGRGE